MTVKIFQKGFNFSQDGPGNRLVYHLQGCNMHCPWCSNPEGIKPEGCEMTVGGKTKRSCTEHTVEEITDEVRRCRMMFFDGGGVTFTGGEATVQFEALSELLSRLRSEGINTAIETNASHPRLPELFEKTDHLITDIKHYDNAKHTEATGIGNKTVIENITRAAKERRQLLVRIPLIGGFNSSKEDAEGFCNALVPALSGTNALVEVLRYHEYGKDKWAQCGMEYGMKNAEISDDVFFAFCSVLTQNGLTLTRT